MQGASGPTFGGSSAQEPIPPTRLLLCTAVVGSAEPIYLMCFLVPEAAEQPVFKDALSSLAKKVPVGREPLSFPILSPEVTLKLPLQVITFHFNLGSRPVNLL
ncbi:UNVERIFIED_CONTAM: hypothetical protein FKN15_037143 [Acipenser sinensis]